MSKISDNKGPLRRALFFAACAIFAAVVLASAAAAQPPDPRAEAVIAKAVAMMGGEKYLAAKSQLSRGKFSVIRDGAVVSFRSFTDVIVFPDKERSEFRGGGGLVVQANSGNSGWIFDNEAKVVRVQSEKQLADFRRGIRTSLDSVLRGAWRGDATLSYLGKRAGMLGRRNDAIRLTFNDGFIVDLEFEADVGTPVRAMYTSDAGGEDEQKQEDRYAQFVDVGGIKAPFIIDRFTNGQHSSRINYESVEYNKPIPDAVFAKPANAKELKKDLKL